MWLIAISGWILTSLALAVPVARTLRFQPVGATVASMAAAA